MKQWKHFLLVVNFPGSPDFQSLAEGKQTCCYGEKLFEVLQFSNLWQKMIKSVVIEIKYFVMSCNFLISKEGRLLQTLLPQR